MFGYVTVRSEKGDSFTARFDVEQSMPTGASATITDTDRPKRTSLTDWTGDTPRRQTLTLLLDGLVSDTDITPQLRAINRMSGSPGAHQEPPKLTWDTGGLLDADFTRDRNARWWMEEPQWDGTDALYVSLPAGPEPRRRRVTITLVRIVRGEVIRSLAQRQKAKAKAGTSSSTTGGARPGTTPYHVRQGDTLRRIAERVLGDSDKWRDIWQLNRAQVPDPNKVKAGSTILVPKKG